jgi:hypothetical protein
MHISLGIVSSVILKATNAKMDNVRAGRKVLKMCKEEEVHVCTFCLTVWMGSMRLGQKNESVGLSWKEIR